MSLYGVMVHAQPYSVGATHLALFYVILVCRACVPVVPSERTQLGYVRVDFGAKTKWLYQAVTLYPIPIAANFRLLRLSFPKLVRE